MKKILLLNISFLLVVFIFFEFLSFLVLNKKYNINHLSYNKIINPTKEHLLRYLRPIEYKNNEKSPILLFGCSVTYGHGLKEEETFAHILSDSTQRTVINLARQGESSAFFYYILSHQDIFNEIIKNKLINKKAPEYAIYTYIPMHEDRNLIYRYNIKSEIFRIRYKLINNNLIEDRVAFPLLHSLYSVIIIEEITNKINCLNKEYKEKLFSKLMKESIKILKKNFPDIKTYIIFYPANFRNKNADYKHEIEMLNKIDENTKVIDLTSLNKEIYNREYWLEQDPGHPSALAWRKNIPIIINELNIK